MTDDIVTRLRDRVAAKREFVPEGSVGHLIYEAADEIERLREQLAISKHECQMADDAVQDLQTRLIKAVRGGL